MYRDMEVENSQWVRNSALWVDKRTSGRLAAGKAEGRPWPVHNLLYFIKDRLLSVTSSVVIPAPLAFLKDMMV